MVETNAGALIEVLRGIPKQRHTQGRLDRDAGLQGARPIRATGQSGKGLRIPGRRHGTCEESAAERATLEGCGLRRRPVGVFEARQGSVARRVAGGDEGTCWLNSTRSTTRSWLYARKAYCGLGIVMRSSSDWVRTQTGDWVKVPVQQTRGLNRNFNHTLKRIFKGAATTVIGRAEDGPLYRHYESLLDGGTKPNLAKLTIARQIASITLALWRTGERYDPTKLEATK